MKGKKKKTLSARGTGSRIKLIVHVFQIGDIIRYKKDNDTSSLPSHNFEQYQIN